MVQHKDWLLLQVLRAGADDSKKVTPVEVCPSLDFADHCWDMQLVVCHLGSTASQGHYAVLKPSVSDSEDWVVHDDAVCRPADSSEIAAIPANWSLVLFRRRLQVRASAVSAEAPNGKLVVAQEQCEADLATCQEAPAAPQSMPDLPASVPDPASDGAASVPTVSHDLGVSCLGCAALELRLELFEKRLSELNAEVARLQALCATPPVPSALSLHTSVIGSAPAAAPLAGSQAAVSVDGSLPVSVPPPAVREPAPADTFPSRKSHNSPAEVEQRDQSLGQNTANFARSSNPAVIAELARLGATAGAADKVWLLERLHADALLLPLAYLVRHGCSWDLLGEAFRYSKREIQTRLQTEAIHDPGICWALVRLLQRGRYNRFVALHASAQWKSFVDSVKCVLSRTGGAPLGLSSNTNPMPIGVVGLYSPTNGINVGGPAVLFPRVCLVLRLLSLVIPVDLGSLMSSLLSVLQFALLLRPCSQKASW